MAMAPLGFFAYGGMIAIQSLWAGPWLTRVSGWTAGEAAQGLFFINLSMLFAFMTWGAVMPQLTRRGWNAARLMAWGLPLSLLVLALIVGLGGRATAALWALWCVSSTFVSVSQPAVGAAFAASQAGRALSAFNLVIFGGVFCVQWGWAWLSMRCSVRACLSRPRSASPWPATACAVWQPTCGSSGCACACR